MGRVDRRRADHHLCAIGPEECHLLRSDLVGHREDAAVAAAGGDDGQADAGVARRRLDDGPARPEPPLAFRRIDHGERGAVLDAASGVQELQLGQHLAGKVPSDPVETDEGGVADQVQQRVGRLDRRTRIGDRTDLDGRTHLDRHIAQYLDRQTGVVQLVGYLCQPGPAFVTVGCDHSDRTGDVRAQVGDDLRWQRSVGHVHSPAGTCGQAPGHFGCVDYEQDVHGGCSPHASGSDLSTDKDRTRTVGALGLRQSPPGRGASSLLAGAGPRLRPCRWGLHPVLVVEHERQGEGRPPSADRYGE